MKTYLSIIPILLMLCISLLCRANTHQVLTTNDHGPGSLRQAIADARSGDVIRFELDGIINLTSGPLLITKGLTIDGGNREIYLDANRKGRILEIQTTDSVRLINLTLQFGHYPQGFGGAVWADAPLIVRSCTFQQNTAGNAGAIFTRGGMTTLEDCRFLLNESEGQAGAINSEKNIVLIDRCVFFGNRAGTHGGAILNGGGNMRISNCSITDNDAIYGGGGIWNSGCRPLTIQNSEITNNQAKRCPDIQNDGTIYGRENIVSDFSGSGLDRVKNQLNDRLIKSKTLVSKDD